MNDNASNFALLGPGADEYYDENSTLYYQQEGEDEYYEPNAGYSNYSEGRYIDQQQYQAEDFQGQWNAPAEHVVASTVESGYYFPVPHMQPQLYGAPVSAIAFDSEYAAIYVASHTQPFGERPRRASVLATHSTVDGRLYSSCGGHPEGDLGALQSVYKTCYTSSNGQASIGQRRHQLVPPHAFQPPYGATLQHPQAAHMGITTLLQAATGYITSISPAGVRVHTMGGLCISDNDTSGMICGAPHPESGTTHVSVGGCNSQIHCMDIYQDLRIVSSHHFASDLSVTAMAQNEMKQAIVAGCSDGTLRLVDGRMRGAEVAKIKSHSGGVSSVSSSPDGTLVGTTGFAAKSVYSTSGPFAYPDHNVLIYDVRFLGRGGIVHTFSGVKGAPRFLSFMPDMENRPKNRFLVASGQAGGGMQVVVPFEELDQNPSSFLFPQLEQGESISCMTVFEERAAVGTSKSNVLQFELIGYKERTKSALDPRAAAFSRSGSSERTSTAGSGESTEKLPPEMPAFYPELPPMSIDPSVLFTKQTGMLNSVFSAYIMCRNPQVTPLGSQEDNSTFGPIATKPMLPSSKRTVSDSFLSAGSRSEGDSGIIVPTSAYDVLLVPKGIVKPVTPDRKGSIRKGRTMLANPNKLIFSDKISSICYLQDTRKKGKSTRWKSGTRGSAPEGLVDDNGQYIIPDRYRLTLRPQNVATNHFTHSKRNGSGLWPGWDYPPSMPSSHTPSVLALFYFVPEVRAAMLERQFDKRLYASKTVDQVPTLCTELGFLFNNMESISQNAMVYPGDGINPHVGVFIPTNFLTAFSTMPEAVNLALLDDNPAVAPKARRPEAFYRFLLHHLDKEAGIKKSSKKSLLDSLHGINFISSNEVASGKGEPKISTTRSLTLDLSYEPFVITKDQAKWRFGDILCHSLCRETKYRSWNNASQSYETVVQRKIATSLPDILSLSCSCAGRKPEEGLSVWRTSFDDCGLWLPELFEVELEEDGSITVREQVDTGENQKKWLKVEGKTRMPPSCLDVLAKERGSKTKMRYRLESVLSFVRDDSSFERGFAETGEEADGHHVLHMRVSPEYRKRALTKQREHAEQMHKLMQKSDRKDSHKLTMTSKTPPSIVKTRIEKVKDSLKAKIPKDWVLFNGYVVTPTTVEDARAFHVDFKEPCIVMYRAVGDSAKASSKIVDQQPKDVTNVMQSRSISTGKPSKYSVKNVSDLPDSGDIVALDAEFVSVQEEEIMLGDSGNKIVIRETRHALGRVSVIDCRSGNIIIDDHVLPKEPVFDYLTRFSGIVEGDLDPKTSIHHLVTARTAYLKLRLLMERGCIFLGHGLSTDFLTVNMFVPPCQIIDTVEIYHKDHTRYISLRFLANYVLKRDMQQDVHDSVEDAMAAFELYQRAESLIAEGAFDAFLNGLYAFGQQNDWRLGAFD